MNPKRERLERILIWTASLIGVCTLLLRAPIPTVSALITGGVAALASRYATVGIVTGAVVLPLLMGIAAGRAGIDLAVSVLITAMVLWGCRRSSRRLRRGEEKQMGGTFRAPFEQTVVGLWAPPAPHGLLGQSALPVGAILIIVATIGLAIILTVRLA